MDPGISVNLSIRKFFFDEIILSNSLWKKVLLSINGNQYKKWVDGNLAAKLGHCSLLVLKHENEIVHSSVRNLIKETKSKIPHEILPINLITVTKKAWDWAALHGHMDVMQWLHDNHPDICVGTAAFDNACKAGHFGIINWMVGAKHFSWTAKGMDWAAENGHLQIIEYIFDQTNGCAEWTADAIDYAAGNGLLKVIKWLQSKKSTECTSLAIDLSATNGHIETVKWLSKSGAPCTSYAMAAAAQHGHLDVVEWLHSNRIEGCSGSALNWAAAGGHLSVVQWLHKNRIGVRRTSKDAMDFAASNGHLDVVKWLYTHRKEGFSLVAREEALKNGHGMVAEWLRLHPCGNRKKSKRTNKRLR